MHLSTEHDNIISNLSGIFHHVSHTSSSKYLSRKLNLSYVDSINWKIRIIAFEKIPLYIHMWASKSLSNFEGTAHRMNQQVLWDSPLYRFSLNQVESDTTHIFTLPKDPSFNQRGYDREICLQYYQTKCKSRSDVDLTLAHAR